MENTHRYMLSIPLNIESLDNIPDGVLWEDIKFEDYQISKHDYDNLFKLFCQLDKPLDILIDEYEEEEILANRIQEVITITEAYIAKASSAVKASAEKFLAVLKRAKELDRPVELFF